MRRQLFLIMAIAITFLSCPLLLLSLPYSLDIRTIKGGYFEPDRCGAGLFTRVFYDPAKQTLIAFPIDDESHISFALKEDYNAFYSEDKTGLAYYEIYVVAESADELLVFSRINYPDACSRRLEMRFRREPS